MTAHQTTLSKAAYWIASVALMAASQSATAGLIFTDRAAFEAAVSGQLVGTEDFESFTLGSVSNPLTIMGGLAQVSDTNPSITIASNSVGGPSPSQAWIGNVSASGNPVTIEGLASTALGFTALGFDYAQEFTGQWSFVHSGGTDIGALIPSGPPTMDKFVGWVGTGNEVLSFAVNNNGGIILDNMVGYASVPEPSIIALMGLGLAGIGLFRKRKVT